MLVFFFFDSSGDPRFWMFGSALCFLWSICAMMIGCLMEGVACQARRDSV